MITALAFVGGVVVTIIFGIMKLMEERCENDEEFGRSIQEVEEVVRFPVSRATERAQGGAEKKLGQRNDYTM